ncbi:MAG: DUF523 and DUF1722 domain-containing protein [Candidatus Cloacimonetes bacterium]|nr:DUF523 and DUF1722 domain-containing protein [Candidatus Cloacimonadota bacterium]
MNEDRIRLGISTCLLGEKVRYDGQHKYDRFLVETLGPYVEYVPVCPEVESGLPIPREAMRLVGDPQNPKLLTTNTGIDHTDRMLNFSRKKVKDIHKEQLCGFVFKSKSPSSGMERVKVYSEKGGTAQKNGVGLFAREFMNSFPLLPVEEDGRLNDPLLRENFIERIFIMHRWQQMLNNKPKVGELVKFHTKHKLLIMAHSPEHYRVLGKLVADAAKNPFAEIAERYLTLLMEGTKRIATRRKHQNVLLHILGYFKKDLTSDEKAELLEIIEQFKTEHLPLIVPITLINHYVRKYHKPYLAEQYYLNPHPKELNLRNHC